MASNIDIKNLQVGLVPALVGFIAIVGWIVTGVVWAKDLEKEVAKTTSEQQKTIELQQQTLKTLAETIRLQKDSLKDAAENARANREALIRIEAKLESERNVR